MPHHYYHGRTGVIFNVNKRAVGVEVSKRVRGRFIMKRLNLRTEHVRPSNGRMALIKRLKVVGQMFFIRSFFITYLVAIATVSTITCICVMC